MQHIQDKELDQLFKGTFEDAEVTPSAGLWAAIEQEMQPNKKKKSFPIFWSAAATIAIAITVTMVLNKEDKMNLYGTSIVSAAPATAPVVIPEIETTTKVIQVATKRATVKATVKTGNVQVAIVPVVEDKTPEVQQVIAKVETPKQPQRKESIDVVKTEDPVIYTAANNLEQQSEVANDNTQAERKGIRNIGDLVNYVVDKVDKRDKKAIRFKTDDDESSIVGINIGFLKFNSKKKDR